MAVGGFFVMLSASEAMKMIAMTARCSHSLPLPASHRIAIRIRRNGEHFMVSPRYGTQQ